MLPCKSKERRKKQEQEKGVEKEELNFLVQPREDKEEILWGTCLTRERKDCFSPFQLLAFILFTPHPHNSIF